MKLASPSLLRVSVAEHVTGVVLSVNVEPEAGLVDAVRRETEGNPFFVSEVVRLLAAEGRFGRTRESGLASLTIGIPESVRDVIGRRNLGCHHDSRESAEQTDRLERMAHSGEDSGASLATADNIVPMRWPIHPLNLFGAFALSQRGSGRNGNWPSLQLVRRIRAYR